MLVPQRDAETTQLPAGKEIEFRKWLKRNRVTDLDDPNSYYDYRGAFLAGINRDPGEEGHFPDTFKQHGHPTFSRESKYSKGEGDGGTWEGETFIPPPKKTPNIVPVAAQDVTATRLPARQPINTIGPQTESDRVRQRVYANSHRTGIAPVDAVVNRVNENIRSLHDPAPKIGSDESREMVMALVANSLGGDGRIADEATGLRGLLAKGNADGLKTLRQKLAEGNRDAVLPATQTTVPLSEKLKGLLKASGDSVVSRVALPKGKSYTAPLDEGADPRVLNIAKLNLSPKGETKLRELLPPTGEKQVVTHEQQQEMARQLEMVPEDLKQHLGHWSPAEHLAAANIVSENMDRIVALSKKVTDLAVPQAERDAAQAEINSLSSDVTEFTKGIATSREQKGRSLNALKILANRNMEPSTWLAQAQRVKGNLPLSIEEQAEIHKLTVGNDRTGLIQYINKLSTPHPLDQLLGLWKTGLLTALRTHEVNMASNAAMSVAESVKDAPAALVDRFIALVRNERNPDGSLRLTKSPSIKGNIIDPIKALRTGGKEAKEELVRQVKGIPDQEALNKYDFHSVHYDNWFGSDFWNAYTRTVFGSLSAEDRIARAVNVARSLEENIRLKAPELAKAQGVPRFSPEYDKFVEGLRKNPPDALMLPAIEDAAFATFNNPNKLADAVSAFKNKLPPKGKAGAEFVMPFTRTPTNVVARLIDYSPVGLTRTFKIFAKELSEPEQKKLAENLGRSITGSGLVVLGAMLAREGKATGAAPSQITGEGPGQRAMWEEQGKIPNAVRIGDKWVQVANISPPGMLVALGAQMWQAAQMGEGDVGKIANAAFTIPRVALDQSFLKGVSGTLEAVNDPGHFGEKFAENTVGSIIPAGVASIARGMDPIVRQPTGIKETLESRIPGLADNVPARIKPFGEVATKEGGFLNNTINPLNTRTANDDPLLAQMEGAGVTPGLAGKTFKSGGVTVKRTPEEQRKFQQEYGRDQKQLLRLVLQSPLMRNAPAFAKERALESAKNYARQIAKAKEQQDRLPELLAKTPRRKPR